MGAGALRDWTEGPRYTEEGVGSRVLSGSDNLARELLEFDAAPGKQILNIINFMKIKICHKHFVDWLM